MKIRDERFSLIEETRKELTDWTLRASQMNYQPFYFHPKRWRPAFRLMTDGWIRVYPEA